MVTVVKRESGWRKACGGLNIKGKRVWNRGLPWVRECVHSGVCIQKERTGIEKREKKTHFSECEISDQRHLNPITFQRNNLGYQEKIFKYFRGKKKRRKERPK